jgi:hypothetical protein
MIYLYGFVPADARLPAGGLLGVGDSGVELDPAAGFAAAIGRLSEEEFGGAVLERNCADVKWMAEQGLRHEQVVSWFVDHDSILPSRLLTLFSSVDALRAAARDSTPRIVAALARFEGLREWNLKATVDTGRLEQHLAEVSADIGRLDDEIQRAAPGRAFLLRKQRRDLARTECRAVATRLAREVLTSLQPYTRELKQLAPATADTPVVLNAALLLPRGHEQAARERARGEAERLERLGLQVHFSGPWAPYRFIESEYV